MTTITLTLTPSVGTIDTFDLTSQDVEIALHCVKHHLDVYNMSLIKSIVVVNNNALVLEVDSKLTEEVDLNSLFGRYFFREARVCFFERKAADLVYALGCVYLNVCETYPQSRLATALQEYIRNVNQMNTFNTDEECNLFTALSIKSFDLIDKALDLLEERERVCME